MPQRAAFPLPLQYGRKREGGAVLPFEFDENIMLLLTVLTIVEAIFASVILSILKDNNKYKKRRRLKAHVVSVETLEGSRPDEAPAYAASVLFTYGGRRYEKELPVMVKTRPPDAGQEMEILFDPKSGAVVAADEADTEKTGIPWGVFTIGVNIYVLLFMWFVFKYNGVEIENSELLPWLAALLCAPVFCCGIFCLRLGCEAGRMKRSKKLRLIGGVFVGYRYEHDVDDDCDYIFSVCEYKAGNVMKRTESKVGRRMREEQEDEPGSRLVSLYKEYKAQTGRTLPDAERLLHGTRELRPGDRVTLCLDEKTGEASEMMPEGNCFALRFIGAILLAVGLVIAVMLYLIGIFC